MTGKIFVITGPSGVGKGTLCSLLLAEEPGLTLSVSATSRGMRSGETHGINYHFKTPAEFEAMVAHDAVESDPRLHHLLEWAQYNGNYYGTPRAVVQEALDSGRSMILEIETQGALMVKQKFPDACLIFIAPPSFEELERRLRSRATDAEADILNRLEIARQELALQPHFDYNLINNNLDACLIELQGTIRSVLAKQRV
jgi:guanylate kinase